MTDSKSTIIIGGFLGLIPIGGAVWDYIQYVLGFHQMGYNVYYIEDTGMYPIYGEKWNEIEPTITRLNTIMRDFGLEERYMYRDEVTQSIFGKSKNEYSEICKNADIFINVSCANVMREEYANIPVRILLDTDPMFTQIQIQSDQSFTSNEGNLKALAAAHTHHFTFGENIHSKDCLMPHEGFIWKVTRQPICLNRWKISALKPEKAPFTTLMNWKAGKLLDFNGQKWGQKDLTFPTILNVANKLSSEDFKIAITQTENDGSMKRMEELTDSGWNIVSASEASGDHHLYQEYISASKGELSVAKHTYVQARTGWFSCRSACYLASGRPVIAQDTGWSKYIPTGSGLFGFSDEIEAMEALKEVSSNWFRHSIAARECAEDYFDHNKVLNQLLQNI